MPFAAIEESITSALQTYSNVHRGSGFNSVFTTCIYEGARKIVLEYFGLQARKFSVIFCTPRRADLLSGILTHGTSQRINSRDFGLPFGISALVVDKKSLPLGVPFETGGGTARLFSPKWVIWEKVPDRFEAGTPAIINVVGFARALQLIIKNGEDYFRDLQSESQTAADIMHCDVFENISGRELMQELAKTMLGKGLLTPTREGQLPYIHLDNAASTPSLLPVWDVVRKTWKQNKETQKEIIREVRSACLRFFDAPKDIYELIFTSNTTEAINIAAKIIEQEYDHELEPVILTSIVEHSSNELPWRQVNNHTLVSIGMDRHGFIDIDELETCLNDYNWSKIHGKKRIKLFALTAASNVLGTCNDLEKISKLVHRYNVRLLIDAAQIAAHRSISLKCSDIDYLAFSGHKMYAPFGSGGLITKKSLLSKGWSGLNLIRESGEENAGGIAALGKSIQLLSRIGMDIIQQEEQKLSKILLTGIKDTPGIKLYGIDDPELPEYTRVLGLIPFNIKGMSARKVATELSNVGGIGVRFGCHCSHVLVKRLVGIGPGIENFHGFIIRVLKKMELPGVVRISLGIGNDEEEIDRFLWSLKKIAAKKHLPSIREELYGSKLKSSLTNSEFEAQLKEYILKLQKKIYSD